jgi:formylglycine-generating enzyme required for sulfatase activity
MFANHRRKARLTSTLKAVRAQIRQQEQFVSGVPSPGRQAAIDALRIREAEIVAHLEQLVGRKTAADPASVGHPEVVYEPADVGLQQAARRYLLHLVDRYRYLEFKGMGVVDRVPMMLKLQDLYVPLRAIVSGPSSDDFSPDEARHSATERNTTADSKPVLDLVASASGLVVLGNPGSGKTTILKQIALALATGRGPQMGLGSRFPVIVPISSYANALEHTDISLQKFLALHFRDRGIDIELERLIDDALRTGLACVMLDGLDEVHDPTHRRVVLDRVVDLFTFYRRAGNRFVITSRIVGYRDVRPSLEGLLECTLVDFADDDIARFADKWTAAVERAAKGDTAASREAGEREREDLLISIRRSPGVRRLAGNPLMLTILALLKRQGVALPERRVELYGAAVASLARHWNLARGLGRPPRKDLDISETVRVLGPVALWVHEATGTGVVHEDILEAKLSAVFYDRGHSAPSERAREFLADVREYSGLLVERAPASYGFIHLTFQEYLAATALAGLGQRDVDQIVDFVAPKLASRAWNEVIRLLFAYIGIVQHRDEAVTELLDRLLVGATPAGLVVLGYAAGDAMPGGLSENVARTLAGRLASLMTSSTVEPLIRVDAGRALAGLSDPRPGLRDVPSMRFCMVPAGAFLMGDEEPRSVPMPEYWIAKYPVTFSQFMEFVTDGGYADRELWSKNGWRWREETGTLAPVHLEDPFRLSNHPVVGVTWHEAAAFAAWLGRRLVGDWAVRLPSEAEWEKAARGGIDVPRDAIEQPLAWFTCDESVHPGHQVSKLIPNPHPKRRFPWGPHFDNASAATGFAGLLSTAAVGCFPDGSSPYGAMDLAGNVWEWLRTPWGTDWLHSSTPLSDDGADLMDLPDEVLRMVRGGSYVAGGPQCSETERHLACCYRTRNAPDGRHLNHGFRIAISCLGSHL